VVVVRESGRIGRSVWDAGTGRDASGRAPSGGGCEDGGRAAKQQSGPVGFRVMAAASCSTRVGQP
jgi:hypothetical protein